MIPRLSRDGWLLFGTYGLRLFGYGFVSVILGLYLAELGLAPATIGLVFTAALAGGGVMTGLLSSVADRVGRRRVLVISALLMAVAGLVFAVSSNLLVLVGAALIGTLSPSGAEVGPFLSLEQAMLPETTSDEERTLAFSAYNVVGTAVGAIGSASAALPAVLGLEPMAGYRALMWAYAAIGVLLGVLFASLSSRVEAGRRDRDEKQPIGVHRSRGAVARLAALFALDSLGSGFVVQAIVSYWFHTRYGIDLKALGAIAFGTDILAAVSFTAAPLVARRFGLLSAAILPHLLANVLVMLVPLMPSLELAVGAWLTRYLFAQMERPARQSYTMAIIDADERAAASGIMSVARNAASAIAPSLAGASLATGAAGLPFLAAGGIKLVYDLGFFLLFRGVAPPEEEASSAG